MNNRYFVNSFSYIVYKYFRKGSEKNLKSKPLKSRQYDEIKYFLHKVWKFSNVCFYSLYNNVVQINQYENYLLQFRKTSIYISIFN